MNDWSAEFDLVRGSLVIVPQHISAGGIEDRLFECAEH